MPAPKGNKFAVGNKGNTTIFWTNEKKQAASKIILEEITKGRSVRSILHPDTREKDKLPAYTTFLKWLEEDNDLANQYARAMEWRAEGLLEDTIDIADDTSNDLIIDKEIEGIRIMKPNKDHILRARLKIEARQFALRKMAPKKYGEKLDVTSGGKELASKIDLNYNGSLVNLRGI